MITSKNLSITKIAITSRLLVIALQFFFNILIPDHDAKDVFISPKNITNLKSFDKYIEMILGGFRRWDGQHFLHISEYGYTYENNLAFYPLYPFIIHYISYIIQLFCSFISLQGITLIVAISFNIICFTNAANTLKRLSNLIMKDEKLCNLAAILYCFNPGSIFFSAPYSESLFAWMSFLVMENCFLDLNIKTLIAVCLSILCRSNGIINYGFIIFYSIKYFFIKLDYKFIIKMIAYGICGILQYSLIQYYFYQLFCSSRLINHSELIINYGNDNNLLLSGQLINKSIWCNYTIPISYSFIQSQYWNVGFFKYYTIKQIPNFILAFPILFTMFYINLKYFLDNPIDKIKLILNPKYTKYTKQFVFYVHATFLTIFCILFIHIQVSTRFLLSSSPLIYWYGAEIIYSDKEIKLNKKNSLIKLIKIIFDFRDNNQDIKTKLFTIWFLLYFIVGIVMFCNFLPWT